MPSSLVYRILHQKFASSFFNIHSIAYILVFDFILQLLLTPISHTPYIHLITTKSTLSQRRLPQKQTLRQTHPWAVVWRSDEKQLVTGRIHIVCDSVH
jgi:hypothetical protein